MNPSEPGGEHNCFDCGHPVAHHSGQAEGTGCRDCDCRRWFVVIPPEPGGELQRWTLWICPDCGENVGPASPYGEGLPAGHIHEGRFDFRAAVKVEVVPLSELQQERLRLGELATKALQHLDGLNVNEFLARKELHDLALAALDQSDSAPEAQCDSCGRRADEEPGRFCEAPGSDGRVCTGQFVATGSDSAPECEHDPILMAEEEAPNVLSPDEARLLSSREIPSPMEHRAKEQILRRLRAWASGWCQRCEGRAEMCRACHGAAVATPEVEEPTPNPSKSVQGFGTDEVEEGVSGEGKLRRLMDRQAEDPDLWQKLPHTTIGAKLQRELRVLHEAIQVADELAATPDASDTPPAIQISVSVEGAKSFVSDSPGWGAMGLQEITEALQSELRRAGHHPPYEPTGGTPPASVPSGGDGEECDSCEDTGIYQEGSEWAPCGDCDRGREIAHYLKAATDEIRGERDSRLTKEQIAEWFRGRELEAPNPAIAGSYRTIGFDLLSHLGDDQPSTGGDGE